MGDKLPSCDPSDLIFFFINHPGFQNFFPTGTTQFTALTPDHLFSPHNVGRKTKYAAGEV